MRSIDVCTWNETSVAAAAVGFRQRGAFVATATVNIQNGMNLDIALEMSDAGVKKWGTVEALRADLARRYAAAAAERNVKVNIDTSKWRDVGGSSAIKIERQ